MKNFLSGKPKLIPLVKTIIMETTLTDFWVILGNYEGENQFILDIKEKFKRLGASALTPKQKDAVLYTLKKEFPNISHHTEKNPLYQLITNVPKYKNQVINKGREIYRELIRSEKNFLFKDYADFHNKKVTIGTPNQSWINRNITDLENFRDSLGGEKLSNKIKITDPKNPDKKKETTIGSAINEYLDLLENNPSHFVGFIEDGEWSILNKIDTNFKYWAKVISDADDMGFLGQGTPEQKIEEFFRQRSISEICTPQEVEHIKNIQKHYRVIILGMSYAEYQVYKDGEKNYEFVRTKIGDTTASGDLAEANFKGTLKQNNITKVLDFSSPGNIVDDVFGVDMMVKFPKGTGKWVPIQIKSYKPDYDTLKIFNMNIGGIFVWPKDSLNWLYVTNMSQQSKSLNNDIF